MSWREREREIHRERKQIQESKDGNTFCRNDYMKQATEIKFKKQQKKQKQDYLQQIVQNTNLG